LSIDLSADQILAGLQMKFNQVSSNAIDQKCRAASVSVMRHVSFDAGIANGTNAQVAALGKSVFNLSSSPMSRSERFFLIVDQYFNVH